MVPGSLEEQLAHREMAMLEAKIVRKAGLDEQHFQLAVQTSQQQFQIQMQQILLLKAEMEEHTAKLAVELELLRNGGSDRRAG